MLVVRRIQVLSVIKVSDLLLNVERTEVKMCLNRLCLDLDDLLFYFSLLCCLFPLELVQAFTGLESGEVTD